MNTTKLLMSGAAMLLAACSPISDKAREIVGNYYIPEVSDALPLMELRADGTCTLRAVRPDVLTYSVDGRWDVKGDSLILQPDSATLQYEGDGKLIGNIPSRLSKKIVSHQARELLLESNGINYEYQLR